jgi:hypothetical protein
VNRNFKSLSQSLFIFGALCLSGCGSHEPVSHEEAPIFKGQVAKVEYRLTEGVTVIIDSEGKQTKLEGHPGIPCTEVEIFQHGKEYEIFQVVKQG